MSSDARARVLAAMHAHYTEQQRPATLRDLSRTLGRSKSATYYQISQAVRAGEVVQLPSSQYLTTEDHAALVTGRLARKLATHPGHMAARLAAHGLDPGSAPQLALCHVPRSDDQARQVAARGRVSLVLVAALLEEPGNGA